MKFRTSRWHWQKGALIDNIFHPAMFLPRRSQRARPLMALLRHTLSRAPCLNLTHKQTPLCVSQFESGPLSHHISY